LAGASARRALINTARLSLDINDCALIAMIRLLGPRIFEALGNSIGNLGEEHGHWAQEAGGKGGKTVPIPSPPLSPPRSTEPSTTATPDRSPQRSRRSPLARERGTRDRVGTLVPVTKVATSGTDEVSAPTPPPLTAASYGVSAMGNLPISVVVSAFEGQARRHMPSMTEMLVTAADLILVIKWPWPGRMRFSARAGA